MKWFSSHGFWNVPSNDLEVVSVFLVVDVLGKY